MPLIPPALDDRSYNDLVQDMLASIPAHTPEWTIQQPGDPGRTLIELFAWLGDSILYRANLIPERQRLAFLKLLGHAVAAGRGGARQCSRYFPTRRQTTAVTLAAGASVPGHVTFETLAELDVLPVTAQAYIKAPLTAEQSTAAMPLLQGLQDRSTTCRRAVGLHDHAGVRQQHGGSERRRRVRRDYRSVHLDRAAGAEASQSSAISARRLAARAVSEFSAWALCRRSGLTDPFADLVRSRPCRLHGRSAATLLRASRRLLFR